MKSRGKGLLFAGLGASLWGSAGVTGQVLMDNYHLPATVGMAAYPFRTPAAWL